MLPEPHHRQSPGLAIMAGKVVCLSTLLTVARGTFLIGTSNPALLPPETRGLVESLRWTSWKYLSRDLKRQVCKLWYKPGLGSQTPLCSKPSSGAYLWPGPVTQLSEPQACSSHNVLPPVGAL